MDGEEPTAVALAAESDGRGGRGGEEDREKGEEEIPTTEETPETSSTYESESESDETTSFIGTLSPPSVSVSVSVPPPPPPSLPRRPENRHPTRAAAQRPVLLAPVQQVQQLPAGEVDGPLGGAVGGGGG